MKFTEVDVDKAQDIARKFGISAMPTFVFLRDGVKVDQVRGANPQALEAAIKKHANGSAAATGSFGGKGQSLSGAVSGDESKPMIPKDFDLGSLEPQHILLLLVGM